MLSRITSCLLKAACIAAFVLAMSSQSEAVWYNGYWYNDATYRPAYYTAYGPVYYSTYRPVYYGPACTSCGSACSSCNVGCTTCNYGCTTCGVGCAPCSLGCDPCGLGCDPCGDGCGLSSTSLEPIPETAHTVRSTGDEPTTAPAPLNLDEGTVALRVSPTRQRLRAEAHYRVPHMARLEVSPEQESPWQPVPAIEAHVVSR